MITRSAQAWSCVKQSPIFGHLATGVVALISCLTSDIGRAFSHGLSSHWTHDFALCKASCIHPAMSVVRTTVGIELTPAARHTLLLCASRASNHAGHMKVMVHTVSCSRSLRCRHGSSRKETFRHSSVWTPLQHRPVLRSNGTTRQAVPHGSSSVLRTHLRNLSKIAAQDVPKAPTCHVSASFFADSIAVTLGVVSAATVPALSNKNCVRDISRQPCPQPNHVIYGREQSSIYTG